MTYLIQKDILFDVLSFYNRFQLEQLLIINKQFYTAIKHGFPTAPRRVLSRLRVNYSVGQSFALTEQGQPQPMLTLTNHHHSDSQVWWPDYRMHTFEQLLPYLRQYYTVVQQSCLSFSAGYFLTGQDERSKEGIHSHVIVPSAFLHSLL
jgi:hypothetical protein